MSKNMKSYDRWIVGERVAVEVEGKSYVRVVRHRNDCGMFIVINRMEYYFDEFDMSGINEMRELLEGTNEEEPKATRKAKAVVLTKSGKKLRFEFECGNHVVRRTLNWVTSPIVQDFVKALDERKADPNSRLNQLGGFAELLYFEQGNNISMHPFAYRLHESEYRGN